MLRLLALLPPLLAWSGVAEASVLTWPECLAVAAKENPDLASSRYARDADRASYYKSFNALLPQLSLSNSYSDAQTSDGSSRWSAQGSLSLSLFNMGDYADIRSASASLAQAEASLRQASAALRYNLRRAFADLLLAQEEVEVSRRILDLRRNNAQLVALRYDSGRESRGNMLRAQAELLQAEADLAQSRRDLHTAQRALNRHLGREHFEAVVATGTFSTGAPPETPGDAAAIAAARYDVAAQAAALRGAEASLGQSRSSLWPSLSAGYARSRAGRDYFPASRYSWTFSGTLSYALFGGGPTAAYHSLVSSRKNVEKAKENLRAVREAAVVDVESAWSDFAGAADQVTVQTALLEAARQRNDESDVRYASGLLTFDNWTITVSDRVSLERRALQARSSAVLAEAAWDKAVGLGLGD